MTIIVLDTDKTSVVLAADQMWVEAELITKYSSKLVPIMRGTRVIGMIGTAGSARKGMQFEQLILSEFRKSTASANPLELLRTVIDTSWEAKKCPQAIVVLRGVGYVVDEDGLVTQQDRFAIGTGAHIALGAMWGRKGTAARLAKFGCEAACALITNCGGKIDVFEMPRQSS